MDINSILNYMSQYGFIFLFIIIFLEYLNFPGLAAGIIMPLMGMWISKCHNSFIEGLTISVIAGLLASWVLYFIGYYGGHFLLEKYTEKFPKQKKYIDEKLDYLKQKGNIGIFISKLVPVARTITPIPAGVLRLNFMKYSIYSTLGIAIWNFLFIGCGYWLGEGVMKYIH